MSHHAYVYRLLRLNRKSKPSKWYTPGDFQEAKRLVDISCPQLDEAIDFHAMGLKCYRGLVMPLGYYPGMDDRDHADRLRTVTPPAPPPDHGILSPPRSPEKSKMISPQASPTKGKEKDEGSTLSAFSTHHAHFREFQFCRQIQGDCENVTDSLRTIGGPPPRSES